MQALEPKWTGRLWPNGEFGVSRVREAPFVYRIESHRETLETQFNKAALKAHGLLALLRFRDKEKIVFEPGLSIRTNSHKSAKRGSKGISSYGQKMVKNSAFLMEKKYHRKQLSFGTVTLPSLSKENLLAIAQAWSEITRQFLQELYRLLQRKSLPTDRVCVTEIQSERMAATGCPALHLHFLFLGRSSLRSEWQVSRRDIRSLWSRILSPYVPEGVSFEATENVESIRKSAQGYLGKYMSKGAAVVADLTKKGFDEWLPSSWWNADAGLKKEIKKKTLAGANVGMALRWLCENPHPEYLVRCYDVVIESKTGIRYAVGWGGTVRLAFYELVRTVGIIASTSDYLNNG